MGVTYVDVHQDSDEALAIIVEKYRALEKQCSAVVIVGSDYTDVGNPTEFGFNARIAANLGAPVALVFTGGIRENSAEARLLSVEGLGFMGIEIDEYLSGRGASAARTISPAGGGVAVMVIPTDEELEIAVQSAEVLGGAR